MQLPTLNDIHLSPAQERALLAAVHLEPSLAAELGLGDALFFAEPEAWERIKAGQPPGLELGDPAADPAAAASLLEDLALRRALSAGGHAATGSRPGIEVADQLAKALARARRQPSRPDLRPASALSAAFLERYDREHAEVKLYGRKKMGLSTGLPKLDEYLDGLLPGLYTLGAGPSVGKTTLALQLALSVARQAPVVYLTFENNPANMVEKALCNLGKISRSAMKRRQAPPADVRKALDLWRPVAERLYLVAGNSRASVAGLRSMVQQAMQQHAASSCLVVVDFMQLWAKCSEEFRSIGNTREKVEGLLASLSAVSKELDVPVLAIVAFNRAGYGKEEQAGMSSAKESGDIEYVADVMLSLKEAKTRTAIAPSRALDLFVDKQRDGDQGGVVPLIFRADLGVMTEVAKS